MTAIPKNKRIENDEYLAFVRDLPCVVCFQNAEPHHIKNEWASSGVGTKGHDIHTIPLCRKHHAEFHQKGREKWEKEHGSQSDYVVHTQSMARVEGVL